MIKVFKNCIRFDNGECIDVYVNSDKIYKIVSAGDFVDNSSEYEVIDCTGLTIAPGLVDMHCHLREPGYEYKEDIESGSKSAAAGGFTTIACMPNTKPVCDNDTVVSFIVAKAKEKAVVNVLPIGAITKGLEGKELAEIGCMKEAGAVAISDDGKPVSSSGMMKKGMQYASAFNIPVISHCEDLELVDGGVMNEGYNSTVLGLRGNPTIAENNMIAREIMLSEYLDTPIHIAHVSNAYGVELVRSAKKRGAKVTAETCPHYFSATDDLCNDFNTFAKVNPPLRSEEDRLAVIDGLKDGTLDVIATDHAPHHPDEKDCEFNIAMSGMVGFETALGLSIKYLVDTGAMSLKEVIEKMTINPASILNVDSKGIGLMKENSRADLVLFDVNEEYVVDRMTLKSKSKNTPFDGWSIKGKVKYTVVNGKVVYKGE